MPTFNEAKNIDKMIRTLVDNEFKKIKNADMHLLVVDGNSPDGTGGIVAKYANKHKSVHLITEKEKRGLGMAYLMGFKHAMEELNAKAVIEMDADFQHPPRFVKPMIDAYLSGADYVIGSRYIKGGSVPADWATSRKAISFFGNLFIRLVLTKPRLHDLTTGFRLTDVETVLSQIDLDNLMELNRFAYKVDLLYQSVQQAEKTIEVPLEFANREEETSKYSSREMISTFKVAIILGFKDKIRFFKYAIVGFLGYFINAAGIEVFVFFGTPSAWAAALAGEVAIVINFFLNNSWTFSDKKVSDPIGFIRKLVKFNFTSLGAIIIQFVVVGLAVRLFGDNALVRQISLIFAVGFLIIPYNFIIYNLFIWKTWKLPRKAKN